MSRIIFYIIFVSKIFIFVAILYSCCSFTTKSTIINVLLLLIFLLFFSVADGIVNGGVYLTWHASSVRCPSPSAATPVLPSFVLFWHFLVLLSLTPVVMCTAFLSSAFAITTTTTTTTPSSMFIFSSSSSSSCDCRSSSMLLLLFSLVVPIAVAVHYYSLWYLLLPLKHRRRLITIHSLYVPTLPFFVMYLSFIYYSTGDLILLLMMMTTSSSPSPSSSSFCRYYHNSDGPLCCCY